MRYMRYTKCTKCTKCTRYTKSMRKYKIDRRYLSQYGFHNGDGSWLLARDLFSWYKNKNSKEFALVVQPC